MISERPDSGDIPLIPEIQPYLIPLFRFDPVAELSMLAEKGVRILVVQGTTDLMGPPDEPFLLAKLQCTRGVEVDHLPV